MVNKVTVAGFGGRRSPQSSPPGSAPWSRASIM